MTTTKNFANRDYGCVKEHHVERLYRDAKIIEIYGGTSQTQKIVTAKSILS